MLKERIRAYYGTEENCACIFLRAAAEEYGLSLSEDIFASCSGIRGGFGIGGICSGLVAGVMVLGLLFDADVVGIKRICFLMRVQEEFGYLDCGRLSASDADCSRVLETIAELLQKVIEE